MDDSDLYSDEDLIDIPQEEIAAVSSVFTAAASISDFFHADEFMNEDQRYVHHSEGVRDQLATPSLFKVLTNFTLREFEELCSKICYVIAMNAFDWAAKDRFWETS